MNHYDILEVSPKASASVIRAAYKSLMQRYHPDKNPGDPLLAERAALVVQAYEILSDSDKRSAYDLALRATAERQHGRGDGRTGRPRAAHASKAGERDSRYFWFSCLILSVIILSGWATIYLLKSKPPLAVEPREKGAGPELANKGAFAQSRTSDAGRVFVLASRLAVKLKKSDQPSEDSGRVLFIPILGVKVGAKDAEHALGHLNNTAESIRQKLQESLAEAKFEALIKADGEQYLAGIILDVVGEAGGAGKSLASASAFPESPDRYGVVEVVLPESFSVR